MIAEATATTDDEDKLDDEDQIDEAEQPKSTLLSYVLSSDYHWRRKTRVLQAIRCHGSGRGCLINSFRGRVEHRANDFEAGSGGRQNIQPSSSSP